MFPFIAVNVSLSKNKDWFLITAISSSPPVSLSSLLISMDFLVMFWFSRNTLHIIAFILSFFLPFLMIDDYPNICLVPLPSMISVLLPWSYQANCSPYMTSSYLFDWLLPFLLTSSLFSSPDPLYVLCSLQHAFLHILREEQNFGWPVCSQEKFPQP